MKPFRAVAYTVHKLRFTPLEHGTLCFSRPREPAVCYLNPEVGPLSTRKWARIRRALPKDSHPPVLAGVEFKETLFCWVTKNRWNIGRGNMAQRRYEKCTSTFSAIGDDGHAITVYEFTEFIEIDTFAAGPSVTEGFKSLRTADGSPVNRQEKGVYTLPLLGDLVLRSDDPDAP
jgi:hypothetical protein